MSRPRLFRRPRRRALALGLALAAALAGGPGRADTGRFLAISDVHLDPFTGTERDARLLSADVGAWPSILAAGPQTPAPFGADANVPLFEAALADTRQALPAPDFVIYPGDFVVHRLARRVAAAQPGAGLAETTAAAVRITAFLAGRLRKSFPGVPILPALGNTDAGCGDYQLTPGGEYLAATFAVLEALVGADRLAPDARSTWLAGGYYAARHPTLPDTTVIALNSVLWSPNYRNRCGTAPDDAPGEAMRAWFEATLQARRAAGERVWLILHVPPGVNAYATSQAGGGNDAACAAATVPLLKPRFAAALSDLVTRDPGAVLAAFSGHLHRDTWRLFGGERAPAAPVAVVPSVSPIYQSAPAYQLFTYDRRTGALTDATTRAVSDLSAAANGEHALSFETLYRFTDAYDRGLYGPDSLAAVAGALAGPGPSRDRTLYARFYGAGHGTEAASDWPVFGCTPGGATVAAFDRCRCR